MLPWLWFWAPQLHFPLSGNVEQDINAITRKWFAGIPSSAGDGDIERQAVKVASYGRQLGLLTELILELAQKTPEKSPRAIEVCQRLADIQNSIAQLKQPAPKNTDMAAQLQALQQQDPARFRALCTSLCETGSSET
ncbi:hypothetical protein WKI13_19100 [Teredinibacter turnerae]|uniref:hypothetical protein n=1 Tax=Teredinibacter turnerae TaxID=2426 RepID=UPI00035C111C|nr:hypothetical protein [Teredinibacter turnerae]